jgi:hypothetical protein
VDEIGQPAVGDAFGALLRAQWRNLDVSLPEIVERDDGFLGTGATRHYFDPPAKWSDLDRAAVDGAPAAGCSTSAVVPVATRSS